MELRCHLLPLYLQKIVSLWQGSCTKRKKQESLEKNGSWSQTTFLPPGTAKIWFGCIKACRGVRPRSSRPTWVTLQPCIPHHTTHHTYLYLLSQPVFLVMICRGWNYESQPIKDLRVNLKDAALSGSNFEWSSSFPPKWISLPPSLPFSLSLLSPVVDRSSTKYRLEMRLTLYYIKLHQYTKTLNLSYKFHCSRYWDRKVAATL